jgi:amphi-Trp domain-containing protein
VGKREEFEHESIQDSRTIRDYLKALVDGFDSGKIVFKSEDHEVVLTPNDLLELSIKAKRKGEKNKISLKIAWKDTAEAAAPGGFRIST